MPEPTSEPPTTSAGPVGRPRTAVLSATVAVLALVGGWTWAAAAQPGGFDASAESISALAASATPHRWIMTTGLVITGLAHLVTAWALVPARRVGRLLLAAGGVATLGVAALPLPSRTESSLAHTAVATVSFALLAVWPWFGARPDGPVALMRGVARPAAVVLALAVASLGIDLGGSAFGIHERLVAFLTVVWPLVTAISTWWWAGHRVGSRRVRHVLAAVGLTAACAFAGTAATAVAPATAQTRHYQASVALDPNPLRSGELVATTAFGDLRLEFQGVAPGIRTVPQVKANIAEVLSRPGRQPRLPASRPGGAELGDPRRRARGHGPLHPRCAGPRGRGARRVRRAAAATSAGRPRGGGARGLAGVHGGHRARDLRDLPARPPGDVHLDRGARHAATQPGHPQRRRDAGQPGGALPAQPHRPVDGPAAEVPGGTAGVGHLAACAPRERHPRRQPVRPDAHHRRRRRASTSSSTPATSSTSAPSRRPRPPASSRASSRSACPTCSSAATTTRTAPPTRRCSTAWRRSPTSCSSRTAPATTPR